MYIWKGVNFFLSSLEDMFIEFSTESGGEREKRLSVASPMHPNPGLHPHPLVVQTTLQTTELPGQGWAFL